MAGVNGNGVGRLSIETALVGQMEHPATVEPREGLNLFEDRLPLRLGQSMQDVRRKALELCELKDQERPLLIAGRPGPIDSRAAHITQT